MLAIKGAAAVVSAFLIGRSMSVGGAAGGLEQFGKATEITWEPGLELLPAISPDGKQVAYVVGNGTHMKIFLRPVSGGRATSLTDDTLAVETQPQWSQNGSRIAFVGAIDPNGERGGLHV